MINSKNIKIFWTQVGARTLANDPLIPVPRLGTGPFGGVQCRPPGGGGSLLGLLSDECCQGPPISGLQHGVWVGRGR